MVAINVSTYRSINNSPQNKLKLSARTIILYTSNGQATCAILLRGWNAAQYKKSSNQILVLLQINIINVHKDFTVIIRKSPKNAKLKKS
jgi:hypothetical protein